MQHPLLSFVLFLCSFLVLTGITQFLYSVLKIRVDGSRKFLHISGGLLALLLPLFFTDHIWVLLLCCLSFALLLVTYVKKMLPSVHKTKRVSVGSVVFPIPVYACFYIASRLGCELFFYLPVSLLTLSDPIAEWSGKKFGHLTPSYFNGQKTLAGAAGFLVSALVIGMIWLWGIFNLPPVSAIIISVAVGVVSMLAELVTRKGYDNLTIPFTALLVLLLFFA